MKTDIVYTVAGASGCAALVVLGVLLDLPSGVARARLSEGRQLGGVVFGIWPRDERQCLRTMTGELVRVGPHADVSGLSESCRWIRPRNTSLGPAAQSIDRLANGGGGAAAGENRSGSAPGTSGPENRSRELPPRCDSDPYQHHHLRSEELSYELY